MTEVQRILDQMDRAFSGDAWHGPSLMLLLQGLVAENASKHPIGGAHSIWELVHHLGAWHKIVHQRLRGEPRKSVEGLQVDQLEEKPAGNKYSRYLTLHGIVQHDLYHAGQIALLKKALG